MLDMRRDREPKEPDWDFWTGLPEVKLWQAVALSMNLEPERMEFDTDSRGSRPVFESWSFRNEDDAGIFDKRYRLLVAATSDPDEFRPATLNMSIPYLCSVSLLDFARWATSVSLFDPVPPRLAALVATAPATESPSDRRARRLARFRALGGILDSADRMTGTRGALAELQREEKAAGRPMSDRSDVRSDLSKAIEDEKRS